MVFDPPSCRRSYNCFFSGILGGLICRQSKVESSAKRAEIQGSNDGVYTVRVKSARVVRGTRVHGGPQKPPYRDMSLNDPNCAASIAACA